MARVPGLFSPGSLMGYGVDPFTSLHREVNRLFDDAIRGGPQSGGHGSHQGTLLAPHIDVSENDKAIRISAELPGVSENDVEVSLNDDVLTIRAEKKQERKEEREGVHISERSYGTFQRAIRLPFQVNPDQVEARFENGVLNITLPKTAPQERNRRIHIQGGGGQRSGATIEGNARAPSHVGSGPGSSIPTSGASGAPSAGGEPGTSVASSVVRSGASNAPSAGGQPGSSVGTAGAGSGETPPAPGTP